MRYLRALIEQLRDTQMLPMIAIVDPGANGGLDFSQRTASVFALDLFYSHVSDANRPSMYVQRPGNLGGFRECSTATDSPRS